MLATVFAALSVRLPAEATDYSPGKGYHLHSDGAGIHLSWGRAGLVHAVRPGWRVSVTLESNFYIDAVGAALARHGTPDIPAWTMIAPSDRAVMRRQGSQFTSTDFIKVLAAREITMDGKEAWRDNVFVERLWRTIKYEKICLRACIGFFMVRMRASGAFEVEGRQFSPEALDAYEVLTDIHMRKARPLCLCSGAQAADVCREDCTDDHPETDAGICMRPSVRPVIPRRN